MYVITKDNITFPAIIFPWFVGIFSTWFPVLGIGDTVPFINMLFGENDFAVTEYSLWNIKGTANVSEYCDMTIWPGLVTICKKKKVKKVG